MTRCDSTSRQTDDMSGTRQLWGETWWVMRRKRKVVPQKPSRFLCFLWRVIRGTFPVIKLPLCSSHLVMIQQNDVTHTGRPAADLSLVPCVRVHLMDWARRFDSYELKLQRLPRGAFVIPSLALRQRPAEAKGGRKGSFNLFLTSSLQPYCASNPIPCLFSSPWPHFSFRFYGR